MDTISNTLLLILILMIGILGAIKSANFIRRITEEAFASPSNGSCLAYAEPQTPFIPCKASPYEPDSSTGTDEPSPETNQTEDSSNTLTEMQLSPFHQTRDLELILNKIRM